MPTPNIVLFVVPLANSAFRFRWVACQLEALSRCRTLAELASCLSSLPKSLDATYERILAQICEEDTLRAKTAIQWLAFNLAEDSQLSLEVLADASTSRPDSLFNVNDRLQFPQDILSILSSLVTTSNDGDTVMVYLAHFSVKEYLLSSRLRQSPLNDFSISELSCHANIAEACLHYQLLFDM